VVAVDTGFGSTQLYSACRLTITHHYADIDHECEPCFGTGFLVEFPNDDDRLGLVTNRHLTDAPWQDEKYKGTTIKTVKMEWWQSNQLLLEHTITDPAPLYHDDPWIDVAVIPVVSKPDAPMQIFGTLYGDTAKFVSEASPDTLMFNHGLSWDYLLECERLWPQLVAGEFVSFPGYPIWYDRSQGRPVLRSGMIASDPQTDYRRHAGDPTVYDGNRQILFDAFSTSGNSGSPVYVAARGIPPLPVHMVTRDGELAPYGPSAEVKITGYHRSFLIGINAGHFNDPDRDRPNDHAGLSRMHKLSAMMDILRANEAPHDPDARRSALHIPVPDSAKAKVAAAVRDKSILALRQEGKSFRTIAAEVGCSASTVGRVIKRLS
jgi:Helix-turn-helix domain